jgi:cell division septation protein DedD
MEHNPKIAVHISDLLYDYDCVIIPEFGGFVANYKPAWIDQKRQILHPPSKGIIFNKNLINNDGLLANRMSHVDQLTYEDANLKIASCVTEFNNLLQSGKRVELDKVGILYYDFEKNIQFRPSSNNNYLMGSFGLSSIQIKPVKAIVVEEEVKQPIVEKVAAEKETIVIPIQKTEPLPEKKEEKKVVPLTKPNVKPVDRPVAEKPKKVEKKITAPEKSVKDTDDQKDEKTNRRYWIAAAIFVPIVMYSGWISYKNDFFASGDVQVSDFNPFSSGSAADASYQKRTAFPPTFQAEKEDNFDKTLKELPESTTYFSYHLLDDAEEVIIKVKKNCVAEPVSTDVNTNTTEETTPDVEPIDTSLRYHIIGGCFKKMKYAEKLVARLKEAGYEAYIYDKKNGLHRVSIQSYGSRKAAKKAIKDVKANYVDGAWILKK